MKLSIEQRKALVAKQNKTKRKNLIQLISDNPGLNGLELKDIGWSVQKYGCLFNAEQDGVIAHVKKPYLSTSVENYGFGWVVK